MADRDSADGRTAQIGELPHLASGDGGELAADCDVVPLIATVHVDAAASSGWFRRLNPARRQQIAGFAVS
jgi:hypothetical protein